MAPLREIQVRASYRTFIIISFSAAVFVFVYANLWSAAPIVWGDTKSYLEVARDLQDGRLDSLHDREPGYPLLLLLTSSTTGPTRLLFYVELLLRFSTIACFAFAMYQLRLPRYLIFIFIGIMMLPPYVFPAALAGSENLSSFGIALSFTLLIRWLYTRSLTAFGFAALIMPLTAMARPTFIFIGICVIPWIYLSSKVLEKTEGTNIRVTKSVLLTLAFSIAIIGGYITFNKIRFQYAGFTPLMGVHLSTKTVRFIERLPEQYKEEREIMIHERNEDMIDRRSAHTGTAYMWEARETLMEKLKMNNVEFAKYLIKINIELIKRAPMEYLHECVRSLGQFCLPYIHPKMTWGSRQLLLLWSFLHFPFLLGFMFMASLVMTFLIFLCYKNMRTVLFRKLEKSPALTREILSAVLILIIFAYTALISSFFGIGDARYRIPVEGLFVMSGFLAYHGVSLFAVQTAKS